MSRNRASSLDKENSTGEFNKKSTLQAIPEPMTTNLQSPELLSMDMNPNLFKDSNGMIYSADLGPIPMKLDSAELNLPDTLKASKL